MFPGIQHYAELVGNGGCYALSIIKAAILWYAVRVVDALTAFKAGCDHDYIVSGLDDPKQAGFMLKPDLFFTLLTGKMCSVRHDKSGVELKANEFAIGRYELEKKAHFVLLAHDARTVEFDSWGDARTVKYGKLVSTRVFTVEA